LTPKPSSPTADVRPLRIIFPHLRLNALLVNRLCP